VAPIAAGEKKLPANSRDVSLDFLKGIGCLLMILAHSKVLVPDSKFMIYLGGFAPIFFFSVSGIAGYFQSHKYAPLKILFLYTLLLFLGFSYNGITHPHFLADVDFDILQMIAFGALATYFFEKFMRPKIWIYIPLIIFPFAVKVIFFDWLQKNNIPWVNGILLPPGLFTVFPWLFLFFAGVFAYKVESRVNLLAAFSLLAAYLTLNYFEYPLGPQNKWDMSLGYFLLCNIILFFVFYIVKQFSYFQVEKGKGLLLYWGRNSLLLLFVHLAIVEVLGNFKRAHYVRLMLNYPLLVWLLLFFFTTLTVWLLNKTLKFEVFFKFFNSVYVWIILAVSIFVAAWRMENELTLFAYYLFVGVLTGLYFPALTANFKKM
jgi:fucose 4-O-acetylase-like acetyltransferase